MHFSRQILGKFVKTFLPLNVVLCAGKSIMEFTGSTYKGGMANGRMEGLGIYTMKPGIKYQGQMKDGLFHGIGKMVYPDGGVFQGKWRDGKCIEGTYSFADGLAYSSEDWSYCTYPDRRFWSEVCHGLMPAGCSKLANDDPPQNIRPGCCDTGNVFYNSVLNQVNSYDGKTVRHAEKTDQDQLLSLITKS